MGKKRQKKRHGSRGDALADVFRDLGLNAADWEVSISFTKGAISGVRGAVVSVTHRASGKTIKESRPARTKTEVRREALALVRKALVGLS